MPYHTPHVSKPDGMGSAMAGVFWFVGIFVAVAWVQARVNREKQIQKRIDSKERNRIVSEAKRDLNAL